ncbi:hypothetical protein [Thioalkalivibrio sp. ALE23]|uniref:DUF5983 family protein n=1 Tax=Thioalkalivibrio sp. ALE23 TaxID=1265495 RepID=UPI00037DB40F|nr:hypothetical protein [Thioalkalivibrio sp. ALE23]
MNRMIDYFRELERFRDRVAEALESGQIEDPEIDMGPDAKMTLSAHLERCEAARPAQPVPYDLDTELMAVITTAHLPESEVQKAPYALKRGTLIGMEREEGFLISTWPFLSDDNQTFPQMNAIRQCFHERGIEWVMFDRDGNEVEAFPTYEW